MLSLRITVTLRTARQSDRRNCTSCAIANAIFQQTGLRAHVGYTFLILTGQDGTEVTIPMPFAAAEYARDFDAGRVVDWLSFVLNVPDELCRWNALERSRVRRSNPGAVRDVTGMEVAL